MFARFSTQSSTSTGCQWQPLPKDLPPKSTAHSYFMLWDWDGTLERIHHALYVATRERQGREAIPTAAIIDSQSAKAAQKGGSTLDPQGFDAAKKVTGRKRHILVDTLDLLLNVVVHSAAMQDRDGASASVVAVRQAALKFLSRAAFEEFTRNYPEVYKYLVKLLASLLREANAVIAAGTFLSLKGRVARTLLEFAEGFGQDVGSGRM
jgi:hypothetical protein